MTSAWDEMELAFWLDIHSKGDRPGCVFLCHVVDSMIIVVQSIQLQVTSD